MSSKDKARREQEKTGQQRHILNLGDRAVEVVKGDRPGVWHLVVNGQAGPEVPSGEISGWLTADRESKERTRSGRPEHPRRSPGASGFQPAPAPVPVPGREISPMEEYLAVMSEPAGLGADELARLVPDRDPGTCLSCRLPVPAGHSKCAWCLALDKLRSEAAAKLIPPRPRPVPSLSQEEALACDHGPGTQCSRCWVPARPRPRRARPGSPVAVPAALLGWAVLCWLSAVHVFTPLIIPAVILFVCFLASLRRRR